MPRRILFLCTGNYYRSRYAEALFNHLAGAAGLDCVATSRALAIELGKYNVGPISAHARKGLAERGIPLAEPVPFPLGCCEDDLAGADLVIALKEAEHRAYLAQKFPAWPDRVRYWHVHDLDKAPPEQALAEIAEKVAALVESLRTDGRS
jgi:protein-tyrosine-phosphatase